MLNIILSSLFLSTIKAQGTPEKTLLFIEVARHGARSPEVYLEYNKTAENFKGDGNLLQGGWNQH